MMRPPYHRPRGLIGHYAGFASRFVALVIDVAIISAIFSGLALLIAITPEFIQRATGFDIRWMADWVDSWLWVPSDALFRLITSIASLAFIFLYHVVFVSAAGRTPGKSLMGLRVLTTNGKRVPVFRAIIRTACYFLSAIMGFLGFALVLFDDRRQSLHDKLSGTYVVYAWHARPDETFLAEQIGPPS